ncbi:putative Aminotransferase class-III [metagenome]|uniref:Putative Aminotransferase class-III n=1 Tax=metagenome TaxID=256318 RepID=A0A2P2C4A9_9ZZZZ
MATLQEGHLGTWLEGLRTQYVASSPESARLAEQAKRALPGGDTSEQAKRALPGGDTRAFTALWPYPVYARESFGSTIIDLDGNRYADFSNNASSLVIGHAHPVVVEAVSAQVRRGTAWSVRNPGEVELAQLLVDRVPSIEKVRFANSGTEAVMTAVRLARAFTGRGTVIRSEGSYHGVWDEVANDPRGLGQPDRPAMLLATFNDLASFTERAHEAGSDLAAVLVAPVFTGGGQSASGYVLPEPGFLEGLLELCRRTGALLVFDEVLTLRLEVGGAQQRAGVMPDLTAMGKVIGGGLAVGAVGGRTDVLSLSDPARDDALHLSGTYNGNPLMTAAGIATLSQLTAEEIARINEIGADVEGRLVALNRRYGDRFSVSGCGSLFALQLRDIPGGGGLLGQRALKLFFTLQGVLGWPYFSISTATTPDDVHLLLDVSERAMQVLDEVMANVQKAAIA